MDKGTKQHNIKAVYFVLVAMMALNAIGFWYLNNIYKENQDAIHGIDSSLYSFSENTKAQIKANKKSIARLKRGLGQPKKAN